jgi:23S rRNA (guanosine2251-2'-O)-methyltransferase
MAIQIYGKNPVMEYLATERKINRAFVLESCPKPIVDELKKRAVPFETVARAVLDQKTNGVHQGVLLETPDHPVLTIDECLKKHVPDRHTLYVLLDGIVDPHNVGAILRSAEAGGAQAVVLTKDRASGITGTVIKTSAGAIEHIDIVEVVNLPSTIEKLKAAGVWVVGTSLQATKQYTDIIVDVPIAIVIGNEGKGMGRLVSERVDYSVTIPMAGKTNSLNASVSAGILIFDILRRRRT